MKYILEFDNEEEFEHAVRGHLYKIALDDVWNKCFRPAFKHGYPEPHEVLNEVPSEVIYKVADIYREIMNDLRDRICEF